MAQLLFLAPRPRAHPHWDLAAAAAAEAIHFAFTTSRCTLSATFDSAELIRARLAELARRHRLVSLAFAELRDVR